MTEALYPLQCLPSFHYRIWGGNGLKEQLNKPILEEKIGESWEISTVPNYISEIGNGFFKGKNLQEVLHYFAPHPEHFLGKKVVDNFGKDFPLLIKFINADAPLSVQVHPNDAFARRHENSNGKTEMWYIMEAEPDAEIIIGFTKGTTQALYQQKLEEGKLEDILQTVTPQKGDVFYIPAGRVHAIGKGITLAEIQQTSDVTYRIYDYNRKDKDGNLRELHTEKALAVAHFNFIEEPRSVYSLENNSLATVVKSPYFTTDKVQFNSEISLDYNQDSFTIYIGLEGSAHFQWENQKYLLSKGETLLVPAAIDNHQWIAETPTEFLAVRV